MSSNSSLSIVNTTNTTYSSLSFIDKHTFKLSYYVFNHKYGSIVSHFTLVLIALSIIYVASNASLSRPKSAPKLHKAHPEYAKLSTGSSSQDLDNFINEHVAILTPIFCTIGLLSIHYATKVIKKENISWAFNHYTLLFSIFAFAQFSGFLIRVLVMKIQKRGWDMTEFVPRFKFTLTQDDEVLAGSDLIVNDLYEDKNGKKPFIDQIEEDFEAPIDIQSKSQILNLYISSVDIISVIIGGALSYLYYATQDSPNWIFSNFVAWCFAFEGITKFHVSSFKVGAIILIGLFIYDIYFVFKTDIMVSVATSIDIPIMMRLPSGQNYANITIDSAKDYVVPKLPFSMLGLGDIVIPGAFIAMCLRYDLYKYHIQHKDVQYEYLNNFKTEYFNASVLSYIAGLLLTFAGLYYSNRPQPALLYLSPSLIIGVIITGALNGELKELYLYTEIDEEEQDRKKEFQKKKEEEKKKTKENEHEKASPDNQELENNDDDDEDDDDDYDDDEDDEDSESYHTEASSDIEIIETISYDNQSLLSDS